MKQQHHPIDLKTYQKGVTSDTNKEILGSSDNGEHVDALNMRSISMDGDNFAKKKIKGEDELYGATDNRCFLLTPGTLSDKYVCMLALEVNSHIVEAWASPVVSEDPFIRIDGQIVAMSPDLPFDLNYPLQYDKNENCVSGEIYITNNNTPPIVLSVKDMMDNSAMLPGGTCTQKYFDDFNIDEYVIQTAGTLHKPAFIKQPPVSTAAAFDAVFGSTGLAVGSYSYSYRYVTAEGDRTPFSPHTEMIPVVRNSSSQFSPTFPNSRTFSSNPDISSPTNYGNHIRIKYENDANFDFIEIRRDSWYAGDPIGSPPVSEIIGSVPVSEGLNIIDILDRAEPGFEGLEILDLGEQTEQPSIIRRAKSIRYFNDTLYLMNIGYNSKDVEADITFVDDVNPLFPTIQKLGKEGHKHVYNATMYKSDMRGEKSSFAVVLFDKSNTFSFATPIPGNGDNFQFPNRRVETSADTEGTSYLGTVLAANTDGAVTQTHEVFDHYDAVRRSAPGTQLIDLKENDPYNTLSPTSQNDTASDLGSKVIADVGVGGTPNNLYNPRAFGLDYYSMGVAFKGISNIPNGWGEGFSVVQSEPARRVLAQGLGFYRLYEAEGIFGSDGAKSKSRFFAYFPDLELLYPDIYDDLINNPTSYQLQLVSPLGYFSDVYSHLDETVSLRDKGADIITYARVLRDGVDPDAIPAQRFINPGVIGDNTGILHTDGLGYVAYGKFTNHVLNSDSPIFPANANGEVVLDILSATDTATNSGIQSYIEIEVDGDVYNETGVQSTPTLDIDADDDGVMDWREPLYVINLVKTNNVVNSGITTQFKHNASYIKFRSLILESTGAASQTALLVSERWEDCIPEYSGQVNNAYSSLYRFVWVVGTDGIERRWLNVTFESAPFIATLLANIDLNGFDTVTDASGSYPVYGVYTSSQTSDNLCPIFQLTFTLDPAYPDATVPEIGSKVYVKYDSRIPVRLFSGDTYINESIWAVLDNEYGSNGEPVDSNAEFKWNIPFPWKSYKYESNYQTWENTSIWNYSNDDFKFNVTGVLSAFIRQLVTMWTAETRINLSFAFNNESPEKANSDQAFPLVNYIPRPHKWNPGNEDDRTTFEGNNNLNPLYFDDYGYEWNLWRFGGFRFRQQTNLDYSKNQTTIIYTSVPTVGFEEQTDYCTRIIWSQKRPINIQNTPTVKTFPANNLYDISDATGEIKFAWSAFDPEKGENLYAITNSGICLLMVDKRVIHEINASELATVGSDIGGIVNQIWIDKSIGMDDETWRSWAENINTLMFVNKRSMFMFTNNQLLDVAKVGGFFELFERKILPLIGDGFDGTLAGGMFPLTKEYIINVSNNPGNIRQFSSLIYGIDQQALQCQSSYDYDKFLYDGNRIFGFKDAQTFELGIGNLLNGEDIECYLSGVSDKEIYYDKEFIRIRVNSNYKPERIYIYDSYENYKIDAFSSVVDAVANPIAIKDYFGYECYIPRKAVAPHHRQQGRVMIFKITHSTEEDFLITSTGVQYKALK